MRSCFRKYWWWNKWYSSVPIALSWSWISIRNILSVWLRLLMVIMTARGRWYIASRGWYLITGRWIQMIGYCISVATISTYKDTIQWDNYTTAQSECLKWHVFILSNYLAFYLIPLPAFTRCSGVTSLEFLGFEEKLLILPLRCNDDVLMECPLLRRFRSWSYWCCWWDEDDDVVMYGWEIEDEQVPPWLTSLVFKGNDG